MVEEQLNMSLRTTREVAHILGVKLSSVCTTLRRANIRAVARQPKYAGDECLYDEKEIEALAEKRRIR
jgi:transposase